MLEFRFFKVVFGIPPQAAKEEQYTEEKLLFDMGEILKDKERRAYLKRTSAMKRGGSEFWISVLTVA